MDKFEKWNNKHRKGCFWINNRFIRKHARGLSVYAQMVYIALCCHSNKERRTFIGCRRIAKNLGINKDTVAKGIRELIAYDMVGRLNYKNGTPTLHEIYTDPNNITKPTYGVGPKENIRNKKESASTALFRKNFPEAYKKVMDKKIGEGN